jgi:hypothetical protein
LDLFGVSGRALLAGLGLPEPWAGTTAAAVARVEVARKLAKAIWHLLTKQERFAPARPHALPVVA